MRLPRVKDIKSKLSAAKLLGTVVMNSLQFKLRRTALRRFKSEEFDVVIVDMDGTLYESDANLEALKTMFGDEEGEKVYDSIISKIASGQYSVEQAIVEGNALLVAAKMNQGHFKTVLERIKPGIREQLVVALKKMQGEGKIIVLATLSSRSFGELLNTHLKQEFGFSFNYIVGTQLTYTDHGFLTGVESIVGTKDMDYNGIPVRTKLTAVRKVLAPAGKELDLKRSILITDSYGDIDLAKMLVTILIKPDEPTTAQSVSERLKLADYLLDDDANLRYNLEQIIIGEQELEQV